MKKILNKQVRVGSILMIAFILLFSATAIAASSTTIQALLSPDITVTYKGETQTLRNVNGDVLYPILYEGSTYLPVRAISGMFGADIEWIENTRTVAISPAFAEANLLLGRWRFVSGDVIYYFAMESDVEFFEDGLVFEYGYNEAGEYVIGSDGLFFVMSEFGGFFRFSYEISGDRLTITDEDGDTAVFTRTDRIIARDISELAGKWGFTSGDYIYYFGVDTDIEFFPDGRVVEYEDGKRGVLSMIGSDRFVVTNEHGNIFSFTYSLSGNRLTITDSDGDAAVYTRDA